MKIGDRVKFLNDIGGGVILKDIDKELVEVEREDGFSMPVLRKEIIVISDDNTVEIQHKEAPRYVVKEEPIKIKLSKDNTLSKDLDEDLFIPEDNEVNLFISLTPDDEDDVQKSDLNFHFINDSDYDAVLVLKKNINGKFFLLKAENVEANTKSFLFTISRTQLNSYSKLIAQVVLFKDKSNNSIEPIEKKINLKANKVYGLNSFKENDYFHEKSLLYSLNKVDYTELVEKQFLNRQLDIKIKQDSNIRIEKPKKIVVDTVEVDLHIEELLDSHRGLSNFEIITVQLDKFRKELDDAILSKTRRIVFIHGVGAGKLKTELRMALDKEYKYLKYQDASFKEYGYGATLVIVRK